MDGKSMTSGTSERPALIALDWGTSSLRGFLMAGDGRVLDERGAPHGIQNLPAPGVAGFEAAFEGLTADWRAVDVTLPVVAGGMVGSAQGWLEAPYVPTPADTGVLAERAARLVTTAGVPILIAPGVVHDPADAAPDVMRGEEIQIAGALARVPEIARRSRIVLPGTHSKWVEIEAGRIVRFSTHLTGELFALLRRGSILGRLMPETPATGVRAETAFALGLEAARGGALAHRLFSVRTLGLMKRLEPDLLEDYLSGLLIGHEIVSAIAENGAEPGVPLVIVGEGRLGRRYVAALGHFGLRPTAELGNTAPEGLFRFARAAGLVGALEENAK